ncbi:MAG: ribosome silencing factor [Brachymonas sp.]
MSSNKSAHLTRSAASSGVKPESKTDTAAKRDVAKLTKAIVDGLEDVKAQNLMVFDTEHLSSLFERVIVASGTSNRQTKALSMSVREAVSQAGFPKPRTEGEDNGEWIIVDCGAAVVHIMQPAIRQYYHLEDIWGEKPLRLKHAAAEKEVQKKIADTVLKPKRAAAVKKPAQSAPKKEADKKPAAKKPAAKKGVVKASPQAVAKKVAAKKAPAKKAPAKTTAAKKSA